MFGQWRIPVVGCDGGEAILSTTKFQEIY